MQQSVRETLADPEQKKIYTKMADEVFICLLICIIIRANFFIYKNNFIIFNRVIW